MRRAIVCVGICLACQASALVGQEQPQATFQARLDVVQVDVSVLDRDRKPVRGLTAADFTVLEDGKPRPIVAFVPVDIAERETVSARAPWTRDVSRDAVTNDLPPEGRLVVIMFDWSIRPFDQELARQIGRAVVDQLGPNDLAAVVFSSGFGNAGTPQNFTADRARLLAAIDRPMATAMINPAQGPAHDPRNANEKMIDDPEGYEAGDCFCRLCVPDTIARIANTVRDVRGRRKLLFFIGSYFRSYESMQGPVTKQGGRGGFLQGSQMSFVRPGVCSAQLQDAREKMERATALANLTIHTLDPVGVESAANSPMGGSTAGIQERQNDLPVLADLTGGRTVMNTGTPETELPAIFAESHSYYLIAFAPANPKADGKLHRIEVKAKRPGLNVRSRTGYVAGEARPPDFKATALSPDTAATLAGVLPRSDVPLSLTAAPFGVPGGAGSVVAITLGVQPRASTASSAANAPVKVFAAAFDWTGKSVETEDQAVTATPRPDASGASSYDVLSRLALPPGRYEIRVALDAGPADRASVYTFVDVPDFAKEPLSLSGVVLQGDAPIAAPPRAGVADVVPFVPTARRSFARGEKVTVAVRAYQGGRDAPAPVAVRAQILDTSGKTVFSGTATLAPEEFVAARSADFHFELPFGRLASGEFLLTIEASKGPASARRDVRFSVR